MGKKSNKKKQEQKIAQEKAIKQSFKDRIKKHFNRQTLFGGVLVIIMFSLLLTIGYLLFSKAFKPAQIAKILPEEITLATLEINTNYEHNQVIKTLNLLKKYPEYSQNALFKYIEKTLNLNFENEIKPWLGRNIGIAYTNSKKDKNIIFEIYFAEVSDKTQAKNIFQKNTIKKYEGYDVYTLKLPLYLTFIHDYAFFSKEEKAIYNLIDSIKDKKGVLYSSDKYRRIDDNLPINKMAFIYLDFSKISNNFLKYFPFISEKGLTIDALTPFLNILQAEGFALIALDKDFVIQSFLSLDAKKLKNSQYITYKEVYGANLTKYISADTIAFWGGKNLDYQLKRIIEVLSGNNEDAIAFINVLIQNYIQKYFGSEINFKNDILPLFKDEFALAVEEINGEKVYKLLINLTDPIKDEQTLRYIAEKFAQSGGLFEPKVVEHTLPDGSISKELIALPEEIEKSDSTYLGYQIFGMKVGQRNWGIYYTVIDNIAIIATNLEGIYSTIDIIKNRKISLRKTDIFDLQIEPLLGSSDEVSYFNIKKLFPAIKAIGSICSGKNYFNDGIVTINYLRIE